MKIGITYDTCDTYGLDENNSFLCDLCDEESIDRIAAVLNVAGHSVIKLNGVESLLQNTEPLDIVINSAEGISSRNREALIPSILEAKNIRYIGADAFVSIVTLDKILFSRLVENLGILQPRFFVINQFNMNGIHEELERAQLKFPLIVKPALGGNSSGTFVCQNEYELAIRCQESFAQLPGETLLVQEFIKGAEITIPVFGNGTDINIFDIIGFEEQKDGNFWINAEQKVFGGVTEVPMALDAGLTKRLKCISKEIYTCFGFRDYTRFDFRICDNEIYFLEANAFPYLGEDGAMYQSFAKNGSYADFVLYLIQIAEKRYHSINSKSHR